MKATAKNSIKLLVLLVLGFIIALFIFSFRFSPWFALVGLTVIVLWLFYAKKILFDMCVEVSETELCVCAPIITTDAALQSFSIDFTKYKINISDIKKATLRNDPFAYGTGIRRTISRGPLVLRVIDAQDFEHTFKLDAFDRVRVREVISKLPNAEIQVS